MTAARSPRRRWLWPTALFTVAALAGAAAVYWWQRPPAVPPLDVNWRAHVQTIAGDGVSIVRDGPVAAARFAEPFGVAVADDGTIFVADGARGDRIRVISPAGVVTTLAGGAAGFADGAGSTARFSTPSAIARARDGTLYVADTGNHAIRRIATTGDVTTLAGDGTPGDRDGVGTSARFNAPIGVAVAADGRIVVADTYNDRVRAIDGDGRVTTLAGRVRGLTDGPAPQAQFDSPSGIAIAADGTIYVADTGNDAIRVIAPDGIVSTIDAFQVGGVRRPVGVTVADEGLIFVTSDSGRILELTTFGGARVVAGAGHGFRDGAGEEALFRRPAGIAAVAPGHLIVADAGNAIVRRVAAPRHADLLPPSPLIAPQFDRDAFAWHGLLWPVPPLIEPYEIAGTMGEARGDGAERFHSGIDVRAEHGTPVLAVRDGVGVSPLATGSFGTLNEWMRLDPIGYVHIRVGRTHRGVMIDETRFAATRDDRGVVIGVRLKRGARFRTGDTIGTVNPFNHVHLNVGWPGEELNPLLLSLVRFRDTIPPTIAGVQLFDDGGERLTTRAQGRLLVSGRVQIVVDAWDQVDGNRPSRRLGLYSVGYQILDATGAPAPGVDRPLDAIRFDRLRGDEAAPLVYAPGSGIPFYGQRRTRFLYVVTNTLRDGVAGTGFWDASALPPGDYTLRVHAADVAGNQAMRNRDVPLTIVPVDR